MFATAQTPAPMLLGELSAIIPRLPTATPTEMTEFITLTLRQVQSKTNREPDVPARQQFLDTTITLFRGVLQRNEFDLGRCHEKSAHEMLAKVLVFLKGVLEGVEAMRSALTAEKTAEKTEEKADEKTDEKTDEKAEEKAEEKEN